MQVYIREYYRNINFIEDLPFLGGFAACGYRAVEKHTKKRRPNRTPLILHSMYGLLI